MSRYLVFAYGNYYPLGGMSDCVLKTDDVKAAQKRATFENDEEFNNAHIYDVVTGEYVAYVSEDD